MAVVPMFAALSQGLTLGGALNVGLMNFSLGSTLGAASLGASALSGMAGNQAAEYQAQAQMQQLQAQAAADEYNQTIAIQNAGIVEQQTQAAFDKQDRERRIRAGAARASGGASGIGLASFGDILASSAMQEELDLLTIQSEGALKKREFTTQADLLGMSAQSTRSQIPLVQKGAQYSKASNVLGSISKGVQSGSSMGMF